MLGSSATSSSLALPLAWLLVTHAATAQHMLYTTTLEKSAADAAATEAASFSIPAGQCSGYIDQNLVCGARRAAAVRLAVRDAAFATLRIDDAVTRARCAGAADVQLRVACEGPVQRRRRAARSLPPASDPPPLHT